jgi:hypothetical protein
MTDRLVRLHKDGRVALGRFGVKPGDTFEVHKHEDGRIVLTPVTVSPKGPDDEPAVQRD